MKRKPKLLLLALITVFAMLLYGCGNENNGNATTPEPAITVTPTEKVPEAIVTPEETKAAEPTETPKETKAAEPTATPEPTATAVPQTPEDENFIELAINVYYNDAQTGHYSNEPGTTSIFVTKEGQYTLTFDCDRDLSDEAKTKGVSSLTNLTAIYIIDMGAAKGAQSPLKECNILFNSVMVDNTELTVTQTAPKSAFKSSGLFDTNDPVNAWDGSQVAEVNATSDHIANFTTVKDPKTITITFTLSDMKWKEEEKKTENVETTNGYVNGATFSQLDFDTIDALTFTKLLGNGINLGNTMEAYGHATIGSKATVRTYETYWGQPVTTAEMVKGMKNCGFDTLRIPVAWTNMMDYENGDYTINSAYLDRVEEIVNYALDAEMFVIVNDHWDGGWWGMFGSRTQETVEKAWSIYSEMWTQIAERFKDYSEMLIFESANEELGNSLNDNTLCADSGYLTDDGKYEMTNRINQKFVDIVRSTGGKNAKRFLLIAGFNTDIDKTCDNRYKMPTDTVKNKLLISVHYYTPWNYCGAETQSRWGIKAELDDMVKYLSKMKKFTDMGYGVIIGEYGALPIYDSADGTYTQKTNTDVYTKYFLDNCDIYNYCPVLWSCNDFYNRKKMTMIDDILLDLFTSRCYAEEAALGEAAYMNIVKKSLDEVYKAAPDMWDDVQTYEPGTPVAWIMWNGGAGTYSVGDVYNPADNTAGIVAHDVVVDGAGTYKVSLDFQNGNNGLTFSALAIADGEILYPNAVIKILGVYVDGNKLSLNGQPYTCSDDGRCMRVNLYNQWITNVPDEARTASGFKEGTSPTLVNPTELVNIKNITIEFQLILK